MNIQEDYVSFEVAKLLKDKGFDEVCEKAYISSEAWSEANYEPPYINKSFNEYFEKNCCTKPTLQMVMKWLREVHNVYIKVDFVLTNNIWCVIIHENNQYVIDNDGKNYKSYEEAYDDAIKWCLKDLI